MENRTAENTTLTYGGTEIGYVIDLAASGKSKTMIDKTHFKSPDGYKEYIAGMKEPGSWTFTVLYNPSSSADLTIQNGFESTDFVPVVIDVAGSGTTLNFSGSISEVGMALSMEDVIKQDVTIQQSGKMVTLGSPWS